MKPGQWEKIKELFASALELEPGRREMFLREACGQDESLRAEVESLIAAYPGEWEVAKNSALTTSTESSYHTGRRLGPYEVTASS